MQHSLATRDLNVWYGETHVLRDISIDLPIHRITAIIGPSGCGKSTFLKTINRLLELNEIVRIEGAVLVAGKNIYAPGVDVTDVRARIGMLAQKPFPLPMSIYDNVAYGMKIHGLHNGKVADGVENALKAVGLWSEVADRLKAPATGLSGGQQQRLCLARAIAVKPEILLCDESTASLDPIAAQGIESLLLELRGRYTLVIVTHNIAQARRLADYVMFMWLGELIEHGPAETFFNDPKETLTQEYLARRIG